MTAKKEPKLKIEKREESAEDMATVAGKLSAEMVKLVDWMTVNDTMPPDENDSVVDATIKLLEKQREYLDAQTDTIEALQEGVDAGEHSLFKIKTKRTDGLLKDATGAVTLPAPATTQEGETVVICGYKQ